MVVRADPDYSTSAREITDIEILAERTAVSWGEARLSLGSVRVSHQVVSFLKRKVPSGEVIGEEPLDLPERVLQTTAVWWTLPDHVLTESGLAEADLPGSAHAAEHASIGLLPLFATCDRWDIGGVSTALHPDTGRLTVFVHDGHPGGAGFAERGFHAAAAWLRATREAIASCACTDGCPSCVQSPEVRQPEQPARQARRDRAARPPARGGSRPSRVDLVGPSERKSPVFVAALIVLIVAVLLVIAALFGGGDATTIDMGSFNINGPASMVFFAGMGTLLLFVLALLMFRSGAKRAAARRADRKRVSELSSKLDEYKREERDAGSSRDEP